MRKRFVPALLLGLCAIPLTMGPVCPFTPPESNGSIDDLTQTEHDAIKAAVQAAGAFGQATGAGQSAAGQESASGQPKPGDLTVGTCPEVTTTAILGDAALDVSVDFKEGCTLGIAADYTCSGGATGQIDFVEKTLDLDFDGISCSGDTALTGAISVEYALSAGEIVLDGEWDLTYAVEDDEILTFGNGVARYDVAGLVTTVADFQGLLAQGVNDWDLGMDQILVSYANQQSYVPYGGSMTVSGPNIRTLIIRYSANSPGTGDVEISIDGGGFFTIDIYGL